MKLSERMVRYEKNFDHVLMRRTPVIARIDGRAFHSLTQKMNCQKPFDYKFKNAMCTTARRLFDNVDGCKIAYTQSDEISLCLTDYNTFETEPFFGNRIQKLSSVIASMATSYFISSFIEQDSIKFIPDIQFDCRCFNVPINEVGNYFLYRYRDCTRNAILSIAQKEIGHNKIQGMTTDQIEKMIDKSKYDPCFLYGIWILDNVTEKSLSLSNEDFSSLTKLVEQD